MRRTLVLLSPIAVILLGTTVIRRPSGPFCGIQAMPGAVALLLVLLARP